MCAVVLNCTIIKLWYINPWHLVSKTGGLVFSMLKVKWYIDNGLASVHYTQFFIACAVAPVRHIKMSNGHTSIGLCCRCYLAIQVQIVELVQSARLIQ